MRADAKRNLSAILAAARSAFAEGGLDVRVDEIARRAGVGTATVFRRFATKDDLIVAVCTEGVHEFSEQLAAAEAEPDAWDGLRAMLVAAVELQIGDRGMCEAFNRGVAMDPRLRATQDELVERLAVLVRRAQETGDLRADLEPVDLPILVGAVARIGLELEPIAPGAWRRYLELMFQALRPGAPPLTVPALTQEAIGAAMGCRPEASA